MGANSLHVLPPVHKLDVATADWFPPPGIPKDELVEVLTTYFVLERDVQEGGIEYHDRQFTNPGSRTPGVRGLQNF